MQELLNIKISQLTIHEFIEKYMTYHSSKSEFTEHGYKTVSYYKCICPKCENGRLEYPNDKIGILAENSRNNHAKLHLKLIKCKICNLAFANITILRNHIFHTHLALIDPSSTKNDLKFQKLEKQKNECHLCKGKNFASPSSLGKHMRTVHKYNKCPKCNRTVYKHLKHNQTCTNKEWKSTSVKDK